MTESPSPAPSPIGSDGRSRIAAAAIGAAALFTLADMLSHRHGFAVMAGALVLLHVALRWPAIRFNARAMLLAALLMALGFLASGGTADALALALSRALYLPALLAVMTVLRVAAQRSRQVGVAARFVVQQPPARRYAFLATGAQLLGILLNIGGYQLLLGIALGQRDAPAASPRAAEIRSRRIACAVIRGFNGTVLWSPVGLAVNLLIPLMPTLDWLGYLPYGLAMLAAFTLLGWGFDRMGPRPAAPFPPPAGEGAWSAILALLALVLAITGSAAALDAVAGIPMRAAILMVIPLMALLWVLLTEDGPAPGRARSLAAQTVRALPGSANEIGLLVASGFLGLIVAQMIPPEAVRDLVNLLSLGPGRLGALVAITITLVSLAGISPMISGSACAGAVIASGVAMPEPMLMVATLGGWVAAAMLSPMTSTVAIAAAETGQPTSVVGWRWNGVFTLSFLGLIIVALLIWERLL
ncbi:hypothetical protein [Pararhodobacter sp. CCB-MM2]|uniref:hypothetical protein n=1 Tax=Pararhodobacter sp. CCB-MM2 TaxID=1786003 RepID=UPI0009F53BA8|nr:hypothetical protein [Pararhodobacter sp. CCB-MM2]